MRSIDGRKARIAAALGIVAMASLAALEGAQEPGGEKAGFDAKPPAGGRKAWEYKQTWPCSTRERAEDRHLLAELNELGKQGWELVSFTSASMARDCFVATLKREVPR